MTALDALSSFPLLRDENVRAIIGPGEDTGLGGITYLLLTSQRAVYRVKQGWSSNSFKTHPLVDLRDLRTLSITPSWKPSSRPHVRSELQVNGLPSFKFIWPRVGEQPDTCLLIEGRPARSSPLYPTLVWWLVVEDAERARGTWRGGAEGYPGSLLDSILLEPGEQAIDCLVGWLSPAEQAVQVGGLLLTNARYIFFTRGSSSWLQPLGDVRVTNDVAMQIKDDGAYRFLKSRPLDAVNKATVAFDGSEAYLALDDCTLRPVRGDPQVKEARVRAFVDSLRRERGKFSSPALLTIHPLTCRKCGSLSDSRDLYCSTCGAALPAG
jgi:hypothetical protein